jgi:hypothetical protein
VNLQLLIDQLVRQTTVLIAQLSTAHGLRAPLAHVASQVFLDLAEELHQQGVSRKVSADMFGLALRTYLRKIQRLSEGATERGQSLWQAVLTHLQQGGLMTRGEILARFSRDDAGLVSGVLHDLADSGLVFRAGTGTATTYRAATEEELGKVSEAASSSGFDELLWAIIYREGPMTHDTLDKLVRNADLSDVLDRLMAAGRVRGSIHEGKRLYSARELFVPQHAPMGWEAAIFDHFQAMVRTIVARATAQAPDSEPDRVGGSTYSFEVWPGHPCEQEVLAWLRELRRTTSALRARVRKHNHDHARPEHWLEVTVYGGQCVVAASREEAKDD